MGGENMKIFLSIILFVFLSSCSLKESDSDKNIKISDLTKEWTNSWEEQEGSIQIYRPSNHMDFPPLRYRQKYIFEKTGKAGIYTLAADDAHYYKYGFWNYDEKSNLITIRDSSSTILVKFEIMKLETDLLTFLHKQY